MSSINVFVLSLGIVLEVCLLSCLLRRGEWKVYPYFFSFALWMVVRSISFFPAQRLSATAYRNFYWGSDTVDIVLRFLIVWEVFRHVFPKDSGLHNLAAKGFKAVAITVTAFAVGAFWSYETYTHFHSVYPALERVFGFAQAVLILSILAAARYYELPLGRNISGIALAFGAWASMSTANNAMIDLRHSFLPYWQLLRPLSFVAMLGMWTWAMWSYAPNPRIEVDPAADPIANLSQWTDGWEQATSTVRRVIHP